LLIEHGWLAAAYGLAAGSVALVGVVIGCSPSWLPRRDS
jgi:hypothetical protein